MTIREFLKDAATEANCEIRRAVGLPDDAPDQAALQAIKDGVGPEAAAKLHHIFGICGILAGMCMGEVDADGETLDPEGAPFETMKDLLREGLGIGDR